MTVRFIGLSGPSSSGKTTVAYLLRHIFPNLTYILHADDFCKEFDQIPTVNGYIDCDGPDAVDFMRMAEVLDYMKSHDGLPPFDFESWQDEVFPGQEEKALNTVPADLIEGLKSENPEIRKRMDLRLFYRLSHDVAKERRFNRQGYGSEAKPDEFWKTEDYFEKMVWRCYQEQHAFMFQSGNVEGGVNEEGCEKASVKILPGLDVPVTESLIWTTSEIIFGLTS